MKRTSLQRRMHVHEEMGTAAPLKTTRLVNGTGGFTNLQTKVRKDTCPHNVNYHLLK